MLIKLPIVKDKVISIINFRLNKYGNKIILIPQKNNFSMYEIFISNLDHCLTKISIEFPLELEIINNKYLLSKFYFIIAFMDKFDCDLDFFSILLEKIRNLDNNHNTNALEYINLDYIYSDIYFTINKNLIGIENRENFKDMIDLKLYYDDVLNKSLNVAYSIIYKLEYKNINNFESDINKSCNNRIPDKVKNILKIIYNIKVSFLGSDLKKVNEHIKSIMYYQSNNKLEVPIENLIENKDYFVDLGNDKIIKVEYQSSDNEFLHIGNLIKIKKVKCKFFEYNPKLINIFNIESLLKLLINNDFNIKIILSKKVFSNCKLFSVNELNILEDSSDNSIDLVENNNDLILKKEDLNQEKDEEIKKMEAYSNMFKYLFYDNQNKLLLSSVFVLNYNFVSNEFINYDINSLEFELEILEKGFEDKNFILYLSEKYKDNNENKIKILNVLFKNYNFPLTFNKKRLNTNFELIMYFSFLNYNILVKLVDNEKIYLSNNIISYIPSKLKNLFYNLIKFYYQYQNNSLENITYNFKFYQDYIYIYIIKNIIQETTMLSELFKKNYILYKNLIKVYKTNFILSQMINNLNWNNLSNKLDYLEYFYKCDDYIFYQGKVNKNLFNDNVDYKIKSIIIDKFSMYKYLKNEKDFIKWTKFLKSYLCDLYEKNVCINQNDIVNLGRLIYKLINLKVQDMKDEKYNDLVNFCQGNKKLILLSSRINLKIKEKLPNLTCNLNLGFFAKHLNFNNHDKIKIDKNEDPVYDNEELEILKSKVSNLQKKYYKYKSKYVRFKSENSSSIDSSQIKNLTSNIECDLESIVDV